MQRTRKAPGQRASNPYRPWPARITSIQDVTPTEKLFELRLIDENARDAFKFDAGQFVEISVFGVGEAPISISSSPTKRGFIELCIRDVGDVTGALHRKRCGDTVGIRGPFGRGFPFEEMRGHDLLLVAGGLGMAPLKSLLNHVHDERTEFGNVMIFYGARTPEDLLFRDQLEMWQHREDFGLVLIVDEPDAGWAGMVGNVTAPFGRLEVDSENTFAVLCGPPAMYRHVIAEMRRKGMDVDKIYVSFERRMKCGIGKCGHCGVGHQYVCVDGPVFNYWEAMNLQEAI